MSGTKLKQPYYEKLPYDFMIKSSEKNYQTWVDVMTANDLYNGISLNFVLLNFEDDYHLWWNYKYKFLQNLISLAEINKNQYTCHSACGVCLHCASQ